MNDVPRTFAEHHLVAFKESMSEGHNSLYNVLLAYSKHNQVVGYC
jgi:hypothetical protein